LIISTCYLSKPNIIEKHKNLQEATNHRSNIIENHKECQEKLRKKENFRNLVTSLWHDPKYGEFKFREINQGFWKLKKYFSGHADSFNLAVFFFLNEQNKYGSRVLLHDQEKIAKAIGISVRHVRRILDKLIKDGLIAKKITRYKSKLRTYYMLSKALSLLRIQKKIFKIIKSCLSEYVLLLKDSFVTLYKKAKRNLVKKIYNSNKEKFVQPQHTYRNKSPHDAHEGISMRKEVVNKLKHAFSTKNNGYRTSRKRYEFNKEEEFRKKCEAKRAKNIQDLKKVNYKETVSTFKSNLTVADIPEAKMKQILNLPEHLQQKVIKSVLMGLQLLKENNDSHIEGTT